MAGDGSEKESDFDFLFRNLNHSVQKDSGMDELFRETLKMVMEELAERRMPFGKYGPESMPPDGVPLYDLPWEYLHWFQERGFPTGRLGELMEIVYHIKRDGADEVFAPLRAQAGGRHSLRRGRKLVSEFRSPDPEQPGSVD